MKRGARKEQKLGRNTKREKERKKRKKRGVVEETEGRGRNNKKEEWRNERGQRGVRGTLLPAGGPLPRPPFKP